MKNRQKRILPGKLILSLLLILSMIIPGSVNYASDDFSGGGAVIVDTADDWSTEEPSGSAKESSDFAGDATEIVPSEEILVPSDNPGTSKNDPSLTLEAAEYPYALTASDGVHTIRLSFTDEARLSNDIVFSIANNEKLKDDLASRKEREEKEKTELEKAKSALGIDASGISYIHAFYPILSDSQNLTKTETPEAPVTLEIQLFDETLVRADQREELLKSKRQLLGSLQPENVQVIRLATADEIRKYKEEGDLRSVSGENLEIKEDPEIGQILYEVMNLSLEDGLIRFQTRNISPFYLAIKKDGSSKTGNEDFFTQPDAAAVWSFEDLQDAWEEEAEQTAGEETARTDEAEVSENAPLTADAEENDTENNVVNDIKNDTDTDLVEGQIGEAIPDSEEEESTSEEAADPSDKETEEGDLSGPRQLVSAGENYEIMLNYSSDANIPEGSELVLQEIPETSESYEALAQKAVDAVDVEAEEILSVTLVDLSIDHSGETI